MPFKTLATLGTVSVLAFGAAACGSSDSSSSTTATAAAQSDVKPAAQIAELTGVDTAVTLDGGFVTALGTHDREAQAGGRRPAERDVRHRRAEGRSGHRRRDDHGQHLIDGGGVRHGVRCTVSIS